MSQTRCALGGFGAPAAGHVGQQPVGPAAGKQVGQVPLPLPEQEQRRGVPGLQDGGANRVDVGRPGRFNVGAFAAGGGGSQTVSSMCRSVAGAGFELHFNIKYKNKKPFVCVKR